LKSRETTFAAGVLDRVQNRRAPTAFFRTRRFLKGGVGRKRVETKPLRVASQGIGSGGKFRDGSTFRLKKEFTYEKSFDGVLLRFDFRVRGLDRFRARLRSVRRGRRPGRFVRVLLRFLHRRFVRTLQRAPLALGVPSVRRRRMRSVLRRGSGSGLRSDRFG
jgi:hypothetical protein